MCTTPLFQHTCGHRKALAGGLERCHKAEEARVEHCDDVNEEAIEVDHLCADCFEKGQDAAVEEQMRAAMAASANDFKKKEEVEVEEQIRAALAASANDFQMKEEEEVERQIRIAMAASFADETRRAKEQEERELEMMLKKSMEGVSLEDKWEVDLDGDGMARILRESYGEYRKQQEEEFRKRGFLKEGMSLPEGEWTKRETIHDRVVPASTTSASGSGRVMQVENRPGPSRPGPALAHGQSGDNTPLQQPSFNRAAAKQEAAPPPPPPPSINPPRRLQEYLPNISPSGHRHPLLLNHYISCSHDIPAGIDYTRSLTANEVNAVRKPVAGKCPRCGGNDLSRDGNGKGGGKDREMAGAGNAIFPPKPVTVTVPEVEVERELTPAEIRAKRVAMMEKGKGM